VPQQPQGLRIAAQYGGGVPSGTDFLSLSWTAPSSGQTPTSYLYAVNGDAFRETAQLTATASPRGNGNPIRLTVRSRYSTPGCVNTSDDAIAEVSPARPAPSFSASPGSSAREVVFTDTSSPQGTSVLWIFDDGTSEARSQGQSVRHTFPVTGTHNVALIASNGAGSERRVQAVPVASARPVQRAEVVRAFDPGEPGRQALRRVTLAKGRPAWLHVANRDDRTVTLFLRISTGDGRLRNERRLWVEPGVEATYDVSAYGVHETVTLELVSSGSFAAWLAEEAEPRPEVDREPRKP
jgi:hypothetical protein